VIEEIEISTKERYELVDITKKVREIIEKKGLKNGLVFIFILHTTAGILITENEEGLKKDWVEFFKKVTKDIDYLHDRLDNNAASHIFSGLLGQEKSLIIKNGNLVLGTWQRIFLAEWDGPRKRKILLKFIKD
jgi:secondary thiamine-phosphate synthase enzyme